VSANMKCILSMLTAMANDGATNLAMVWVFRAAFP
jgi:hypothetical protein